MPPEVHGCDADSAWCRGGEIDDVDAGACTMLVAGVAPMRSASLARALVCRSRRLRETVAGTAGHQARRGSVAFFNFPAEPAQYGRAPC